MFQRPLDFRKCYCNFPVTDSMKLMPSMKKVRETEL